MGRKEATEVLRQAPGESERRAGSSLESQREARFLEEAQVTGLEHPGIVPVHEVGLDRIGWAASTRRWRRRFARAGSTETPAGRGALTGATRRSP